MNATPPQNVLGIPIRRSIWQSFWIGLGALVVSAFLAAGFLAIWMWLFPLRPVELPERRAHPQPGIAAPRRTDPGTWALIGVSLVWLGGFFASVPWQRRCSRWLDSRRPGIVLADNRLTVPVSADRTLNFDLDSPFELSFGWYGHRRHSATWAMLSQGGDHMLLTAPMQSTRAARTAGWSMNNPSFHNITHTVWLWPTDIVALVIAMRTRPARPATAAAAPCFIHEAPPAVLMQPEDFRQNLNVLKQPADARSEKFQADIVQILRERCPAYLDALRCAGFTSEEFLHPGFQHRDHLARFAARALQQDQPEQAQAAFAAWNWETAGQHFALHTFAVAIYQLQVDPALAERFVPPPDLAYFRNCYEEERRPGGNTPIEAYS